MASYIAAVFQLLLIRWCILMHHGNYRGMMGSATCSSALWCGSQKLFRHLNNFFWLNNSIQMNEVYVGVWAALIGAPVCAAHGYCDSFPLATLGTAAKKKNPHLAHKAFFPLDHNTKINACWHDNLGPETRLLPNQSWTFNLLLKKKKKQKTIRARKSPEKFYIPVVAAAASIGLHNMEAKNFFCVCAGLGKQLHWN